MIGIFTNETSFFNDIAEEIRLFTDITDIEFIESEKDIEAVSDYDMLLCVVLDENDNEWNVNAHIVDGESYSFKYSRVIGDELVIKRYKKRCMKIAAYRVLRKHFDMNIPWGSLTGIRPTRLVRELLINNSAEETKRIMREDFDVTEEKWHLAEEIVNVQKDIIASTNNNDIDIYIGVPFCKTRCLYCSFASEVRSKKTDMGAYLKALKEDIRLGSELVKKYGYNVRSMYMGGGTPTVLTHSELEDILSYALSVYEGFGKELTVEAGRPDTIDKKKLEILKKLGVNRISINPQSMNMKTLELIGRSHTPEEIKDAYYMAKNIGFDSINMDIIAGLPGENIDDMENTLNEIIEMSPENLTIHTLAIKRSSRLKERLNEYPLPSGKDVDIMLEKGRQTAKKLGMKPYYMYRQKYMRGNFENVGYAKEGKVCIYNIDMMEETTNIMAHGAGAMSKRLFDGEKRIERIPNPKDISTYIEKVQIVSEEKNKLFMV